MIALGDKEKTFDKMQKLFHDKKPQQIWNRRGLPQHDKEQLQKICS